MIAWAMTACRDSTPSPRADAAPRVVSSSRTEARADAGPPPRCLLAVSNDAASSTFGNDAELGEAVPVAGGFAIGALRKAALPATGLVASVLQVPAAAGGDAVIDLGPAWRDGSAPQPLVRANAVFAVGYVVRRGAPPPSAHRALAVFRASGGVERLLDLPAETDASSAFDVAAAPEGGPIGGIVAWDDDVGAPARGVIQLATLSADLRSVRSTREITPLPETTGPAVDAGDPRLTPRTKGFWLTWVARRAEHVAALPLPAGEVETPSADAMYGWVEAMAIDPTGAPVGAARRLTSVTGHVGSYDVASDGEDLLVVAEDDSGPRGGGSIDQVVLHGDALPTVTRLVRGGADEETPPALVVTTPGEHWLTFLDLRGDRDLLPLASGGFPPGAPSVEPALREARLLGPRDGRITLAVLKGASWSLQSAACKR
jgi:hypothetical protein